MGRNDYFILFLLLIQTEIVRGKTTAIVWKNFDYNQNFELFAHRYDSRTKIFLVFSFPAYEIPKSKSTYIEAN